MKTFQEIALFKLHTVIFLLFLNLTIPLQQHVANHQMQMLDPVPTFGIQQYDTIKISRKIFLR